MANLITDEKYIHLIGYKLKNFKKTDNGKYNFSCPFCGDSQKNSKKARGWLITHQNKYFYKCFNCDKSLNLPGFLKLQDESLYKEYIFESFGPKKKQVKQIKMPKLEFKSINKLPGLIAGKKSMIVKKFMMDRKIPPKYINKLFYVDKFKTWANTIVPNKFKDLDYDKPRIVIPFYTLDNKIIAFQGRALEKSSAKYLTVKIGHDNNKIYGQERVDKSKTVYVLEGPLDTFFVNNSVAVAGSDFDNLKHLGFNDIVLVLDNDKRNSQIIKKYKKYIKLGYNIVIWNNNNNESDPNDMIILGRTIDSVNLEIKSRTFNGMRAMLEFNKWKKI